jgi:hypothetical protein
MYECEYKNAISRHYLANEMDKISKSSYAFPIPKYEQRMGLLWAGDLKLSRV